jgi:predicted phosphodiesterase
VKVAVISDSHGDLVALRAVLADLDARKPDQVVFAGDLAQGGPQPAEVMDLLLARGWPLVRGNSDDFLVDIAAGNSLAFAATEAQLERGRWSIDRLGPERLERLAAFPMEFRRPWAPNGPLVVVHATPWSTEDVVLADAAEPVAGRMVSEASAGVLAYGHIHSAYQRRVGDSVLLSAGAISWSNDLDGRPAYTIVTLDETVSAEVIRVDCPVGPRLDGYSQAGLELTQVERDRLVAQGEWPVRSRPGEVVQLWPYSV